MLAIIEKAKDLFKCKAEKEAECQPQQEEKHEDKSRGQAGCSEEDSSN